MLFNSSEFLIFFPVVLVVYYILNRRPQNVWLLLCSYFFYGWWDWRFTFLLMTSTVLNFVCAWQIHRRPLMSRFFLVASLCGNFGILWTFKYLNFFADSAIRILNLFHFNPDVPTLKVILPIGISFYTFQTLAYTIDVYRGKLKPTNNFLDFALYITFFPQLVAGPIERATNLLPQFERKRTIDGQMVASGLFLILLGYTKKVGIADSIAPFVDSVFGNVNKSSIRLLSALYLFSFQIYCDFSGYSDIARGISRLFGFELMVNFNQPYLSKNITEFWRRWHISLSSWLRDYLYIPLGGNRHGKGKTYRNIMITMILAGLWHGANWTFVLWGTLHGLYLVIHRFVVGQYRSKELVPHVQFPSTNTRDILNILFTFQLVALSWVFFRSADLPQAFAYLKGIFVWHGPLIDFGGLLRVAFFGTLIVFIDWAQYKQNNDVAMLEWHWIKRGALYVLFVFVILLGKTHESVPFIYFQF